ncbi:MAG: DNA polymerase III subunit chi [Acidibrevibacterium sp.]|uniref:DNA polymerase III subunit chi n=1 Tax=Acidibrevibacterium sp. TaxID=2606776 RepID=UPI003D0049F9
MAEIAFYHLLRAGPEQALPALLGRTLALGERAVIRVGSEERLAALDDALWRAASPDWLPHGTSASGNADLQPIWLTLADEAPNGAGFLFLIDGAESARLEQFTRVFDLFDGNDEAALAAARLRWQACKAAGHAVTYWQQGARGWEKKA